MSGFLNSEAAQAEEETKTDKLVEVMDRQIAALTEVLQMYAARNAILEVEIAQLRTKVDNGN